MRRFFRAQRDEDCSQIQYLTAKCTRLARDKAMLDREFMLSRDRERKRQRDLEAAVAQLGRQQQLNMELRVKNEQLVSRVHQQQGLVELVQRRLALMVEESCRDAEMLRQVGLEVQCLQSSEVSLEGLVEELQAEAHHRAVAAESLHAELCSQTLELENLRDANRMLTEQLSDLRTAHQKEAKNLQSKNEVSLGKLQETVGQFEWLCQQQRYWMCCVKRFKDCLMEEREALIQRVSMLEKKAEKFHSDQKVPGPGSPTVCCCSGVTWRDAEADPGSQVEKSHMLYDELFDQAGSPVSGYQKPP